MSYAWIDQYSLYIFWPRALHLQLGQLSMTEDDADLIGAVRDQIGLDAYHLYPDTRRLIPDAVFWGIAIACLTEYFKGLGGFETLGKATRRKAASILKAWKEKRDFEHVVQGEEFESIVSEGIRLVPQRIAKGREVHARARLRQSLVEFGLGDDEAGELSRQIAELVAARAARLTDGRDDKPV